MEPGANLCDLTWEALRARDGMLLRYPDELELLETVHADDDKRLLKELDENRREHVEKMLRAMANHERHLGRELIREVDNVSLVIHPDPNGDREGLARSPWAREIVAIPRRTFWGLALPRKEQPADESEEESEDVLPARPTAWLAIEEEELEWALCYPDDPPLTTQENEEQPPHITWGAPTPKKISLANHSSLSIQRSSPTHRRLAWNCTPIPKEALRRGLVLTKVGIGRDTVMSWKATPSTSQGSWRVWQGPFAPRGARHEEYPALHKEMAYTLPRLAALARVEPTLLAQVVRWLFVTHDVGKLGDVWQRWVAEWQPLVGGDYEPQRAYAHTDNDGTDDHAALEKKLKKQIGSRPPHAAESAAACLGLLSMLVGDRKHDKQLGVAALNAVVRHHGAGHSGALHKAWRADPIRSRAALEEALVALGGATSEEIALFETIRWSLTTLDGLEEERVEVKATRPQEPLLYLWLSRVLRLADQRSLARRGPC